MREPAYIVIGDDGYLTLYWGDGTEEEKTIIARGRPAAQGRDLVTAIEELKAWAEASGYAVVVPAYDLDAPPIDIEITDAEANSIDLDDVDSLLDDLYFAGDYPENNPGDPV